MTAKTNSFENALVDAIYRAQPLVAGPQQLQWVNAAGAPAVNAPTFYWGLLNVSLRTNSAAVSLGAFIVLADSAGKLHLLKCTTAGTTAASPPVASATDDATTTDGTVTWTDQYTALEAGTISALPAEFAGGTYARQGVTSSLTSMKGTHGTTTGASSGTGGTTSPAVDMAFNAGAGGNAGLFVMAFEASAGTLWRQYGFITGGPIALASGATATFVAASNGLSIQEDN